MTLHFRPLLNGYGWGSDEPNARSRAKALVNGDLVAANALNPGEQPSLATQAGFRIPVALTKAAWADCVAWGEGEKAPQDEVGRLWDVLWMASRGMLEASKRGQATPTVKFTLHRVPRGGTEPLEVALFVVMEGDDRDDPACTIYTEAEVEEVDYDLGEDD